MQQGTSNANCTMSDEFIDLLSLWRLFFLLQHPLSPSPSFSSSLSLSFYHFLSLPLSHILTNSFSFSLSFTPLSISLFILSVSLSHSLILSLSYTLFSTYYTHSPPSKSFAKKGSRKKAFVFNLVSFDRKRSHLRIDRDRHSGLKHRQPDTTQLDQISR